jgi:L-2-hydroxyglutarate oxidase LhgO
MRCLIIGGGIVGLATARQLRRINPSLSITVLEKELDVGLHQTGRNSGVIHSGIYYKPGSLKAQNCLAGREELMTFCEEQGVPFKKIGKVIVATTEKEIGSLQEIERRGRANGIPGLEAIGPGRLREIEPNVTGLEALWVPGCAIVDYGAVARALASSLQSQGVEIVCGSPAIAIHETGQAIRVVTPAKEYVVDRLINCAGLYSDRVARLMLNRQQVPHQILPFRGEYYKLTEAKRSLVRGLVYPVPDPQFPFLGVHLTPMINGEVEAGPNAVLALAREGYRKTDVNSRDLLEVLRYPGFWWMGLKYWKAGFYEMYRSLNRKAFLRDLQKLVPAIEERDLLPGGAGIRAQAVTPEGKMVDDFSIVRKGRAVHVINAPSPAATASFALGRAIAREVA